MKRYPPPMPVPPQPVALEYRDREPDQIGRKLRQQKIFERIGIWMTAAFLIGVAALILFLWYFISNLHT